MYELDLLEPVDWGDADPLEVWDPHGPVESASPADDAAALAVAMGPGPWSAALLDSLDETALTEGGRIDAPAAWQQLSSWAEARTCRLLKDHVGADAGEGSVRAAGALECSSALTEVALAWRVSDATGGPWPARWPPGCPAFARPGRRGRCRGGTWPPSPT